MDTKHHKRKDASSADIAELQQQLDKKSNDYLRALADYQNLEKRMYTTIEQTRQKTKVEIISQFLDVLDTLEKAQEFVKDDGVKMITDQLKSTFDRIGVVELDVEGKEFDPYTSDAVDVVEGDTDNIVVNVLRKGYSLDNEVIRPAQVRVSKKS